MTDIAASSNLEAQSARWARGQNLLDAGFRTATLVFAAIVLVLLGALGAWGYLGV